MSGAATEVLSDDLPAGLSMVSARGKSMSPASSAVFDLDATGFDKALTGNCHSIHRKRRADRTQIYAGILLAADNQGYQPFP
jgi:hypothetical protein